MTFDFSGKVVMITGGAEKAGKVFALAYAKAGADVVISHYNMPEEAAQTKAEIEQMGRRCLAVAANNRCVAELQNLVEETRKEFGRLDILIHNASNFNDQPIEEVTEEIWNSSHEIILKGSFFLSQAAAPLMLENGGGKMVALIGNSFYENWPRFIPHATAKVGLAKLMQLLAITYSPYIQCNAICPASFIDTDSGDDILARRGEVIDTKDSTLTVNGVKLHRGNPDEVCELIMFLTSCSSYMNGDIISIDGGKHLI